MDSLTSPDMSEILALERQVWEALVRGDASADAHLLHEDFLGVYSTGFADRGQHAGQLDAGPVVSNFEIHDARLVTFTPDVVLLAYLAVFRRPTAAVSTLPERMYVSSVWQRHSEGWLNVFSQDTGAA
jgi:hypothetical protein